MDELNIDMVDRGVCYTRKGCCGKLNVTDWLNDVCLPGNVDELVEVRFKNTRKDYFRNVNNLTLNVGDIIAVESNPGHDIGIISLMGELVFRQMKKHKANLINGEFKKIYRIAKSVDIDKWREAISLEHDTMIRSRKIAADLKLDMKIGDVEYQGDRTKAIFYYIADERVDFRQLIKILAETFHIRVEMKQIGARQEAGKIGGIGPCGREICCSSWMSNFYSVSTNAARYQDISLNPQKLAGQCGKLKCCINFEVDAYVDAQKDFPPTNVPLATDAGNYVFLKSDVFKGIYWYILQGNAPSAIVPLPVSKVKEVQRMNREGRRPDKLSADMNIAPKKVEETFQNVVGQEDLNRFDKPRNRHHKKKRFGNRSKQNPEKQ